ncbi:hypothetical protein BOX15_Mlig022912g1 [Macrostomum lignano]|uniref:Fibronectin type-III domain-containing protein n=1 Tax=Macrostomum lignano TaxID=282301 RepID=A0A267F318_9PLAT|nr:hypothetical protein BOX15_Mlig022912g1 [Macrostomum lignano]
MSSQADRGRSLFCFYRLLLVAAAAALLLCDEAAAQGTSCGKLLPGQVDPVTVAAVRSATNSSITVDWLPPDRGITGYFYTLSCPSCPTQQHNTTDETFTFRDLNGATEYSFSIQAGLRNCRLSPAFHLSGITYLNKVPGRVHISDVTETSFRARWAASPDVGVEYEVSCAGRVPDTTAVCTGQPSGASVTVTVRPVKTGFPPAPFIHGTALTKLFPIDASLVSLSVRETSIHLTWAASITEGVLYRVTCRRVSTENSTSLPPSKYLSATFSNVQSGEAYNLSVAVTKKGGFHEVVTWLPIQLTKLFGIDPSSAQYSSNETAISVTWQPSSTSGVSYQLTCKRVGSGEVSTASSPTPSATCGSLQSGQEYELRVAVKKAGGFDDVITALSNQLTNGNRGSCATADWLQFNGFCYLLVKGSNGRNLTAAVSDCQRRDPSAHLLWITSQSEMNWVMDYSARNWRLREDYRAQCRDCRFQGDAAWTGLYRDEADGGKFKWLRDNSGINVSVSWLVGPSRPPMNFGLLVDAETRLLWRTYQPEARHFHFCKAPVRVQQPETAKNDAADAAQEKTVRTRCPSAAWSPISRGPGASLQMCYTKIYPGSFPQAREECRRWAPNADILPARSLHGLSRFDRRILFLHVCYIGKKTGKSDS